MPSVASEPSVPSPAGGTAAASPVDNAAVASPVDGAAVTSPVDDAAATVVVIIATSPVAQERAGSATLPLPGGLGRGFFCFPKALDDDAGAFGSFAFFLCVVALSTEHSTNRHVTQVAVVRIFIR